MPEIRRALKRVPATKLPAGSSINNSKRAVFRWNIYLRSRAIDREKTRAYAI